MRARRCVAFLVAALVGAGLTAVPAFAQGDWDGGWLGITVGWKTLDTDFRDANGSAFAPPATALSSAVPANLTDPGQGVPASGSLSGNGITGGVIVGFNMTAGALVVGLEAAADLTNVDQSETVSASSRVEYDGLLAGQTDYALRDETCTRSKKMTAEASLKGRIGYLATPDLLLYVSGGLAFARTEHDVDCLSTIEFFEVDAQGSQGTHTTRAQGSKSGWETGWTLGGGAEMRIGGAWNMRLDYAYVDLGSTDQIVPISRTSSVAGLPNNGASSTVYEWSETYHKLRIAVIYTFAAPSPSPLE